MMYWVHERKTMAEDNKIYIDMFILYMEKKFCFCIFINIIKVNKHRRIQVKFQK